MNEYVDIPGMIQAKEVEMIALEIAQYLQKGQLALLLGAGVSAGLEFPTWQALVESIEEAQGILSKDTSTDSKALMGRMDVVRRQVQNKGLNFLNVVHDALYGDRDSYGKDLLSSRMLASLGAIVMASSRGQVGEVFTLNFDDVLDWYLHLHGFRTQVVSKVPTLLRGDVDVRIYHFHGFLPLVPTHERSDWMILTKKQLTDRLAEPDGAAWPSLFASQLHSKVLLFIGTSMNDTDVDVYLAKARRVVGEGRTFGFVLGVRLTDDRVMELEEYGLKAVILDNYDQIPDFLLRICQLAADLR